MKIRRSETIKNSSLNVNSTIQIIKAGEIYAVHKLEQSSKDEKRKAMDDLYHIMAAPTGSSVQKLAVKELGNDYIQKVIDIYNHMKIVINLQSEGAY